MDRAGRFNPYKRMLIRQTLVVKSLRLGCRCAPGLGHAADSLPQGHRSIENLPWHRTARMPLDRKSTRLNSSHQIISYAVFCLKKKKMKRISTNNIEV